MTEKQRGAHDASSWADFLPPGAIIMGRISKAETAAHDPANDPAIEIETPAHSTPIANHARARSTADVGGKAAASADSLPQIAADLAGCQRCKLCDGRKTIVVGEGNPEAGLVFVGEGPGEQEDIQGRPFVGNAGQLLDKMIQAIGLTRDQVYICNVVKCRPPGSRNPEPDEIAACSPFLARQLEVLQPKVVVALGKFAAQTLLETEEKISSLRGNFKPFRGTKLMPTWHPAYLLRNPESKREAWADLQAVAAELGLRPAKPSPAPGGS